MSGASQAITRPRTFGIVTLSGEGIISTLGDQDTQLIVRADGTLDKNQDGVISQIDSVTDWIIPNQDGSLYQVRWTNWATTTGSLQSGFGGPNAVDVWGDISSDRTFSWFGGPPLGGHRCTVDIEIRRGTGPTLASTEFTFFYIFID